MTYLVAAIAGIFGMAAGWVAVAVVIIGLGSALGVAGGDGGFAMTAFFAAGPFGGFIGLVAGVWLALRRYGVGGITPLIVHVIVSLAAAGVLSAAVAGVFWMNRPYVATNGLPPSLIFEIRLPRDAVVPALVSRAEAYARRSPIELQTSENTMSAEIESISAADGRPLVTGRVEMHYRTRKRLLVLKQPAGDVVFEVDLGATPRQTSGFGPWQPPLSVQGQAQENGYEIRYRAAWE
jgi:hypothetical protein